MRNSCQINILFFLAVFVSLTARAATSSPPLADGEYATYYVVVVDTGYDYYKLQKKMTRLSSALNIPIDTMGRSYNPDKKRIVLPEDDEDEIYAGDYYPRRSPSEFLSLEYLGVYKPKADINTIVLVAGIYEKKEEAARMLKKITKESPKAYVLKAKVYIGCMH